MNLEFNFDGFDPSALTDAQLIAGLTGASDGDAQAWLSQAGGIRHACLAVGDVGASYGIPCEAQEKLALALELSRRHLATQLKDRDVLTSPGLTQQFLQAKLRDLDYEVFALLLLDNQHRVIRYHELFRGTIDGAAVYPREVIKTVLEHKAAAVILVHNHPSGIAEPSALDRAITMRIKAALECIDVRLLDHVIVGDCYCESFAERGLL